MYKKDPRIVVTLDAGGTNLVFGAMQACEFISNPISYPSNSQDLDKCLDTIVKGFREIIGQLKEKPVAISFAFPGPADYKHGIIGGYLPNFPSFRDGVALGPYLEKEFGIPVFINNDGDLFAFGEALSGALPEINRKLSEAGATKQFKNLIGYTFGTGFGIGIVVNGQLNLGDNSCVETFCLPHKLKPDVIVEEGVAVRAIKRVYAEKSGHKDHNLEPKDIYDIAKGTREGDKNAAIAAFREFGEVAGYAMAIAVQLIDGIIVIGGGLSAAKEFFMPSLLKELRDNLTTLNGDKVKRVQMEVYDLGNQDEFDKFAKGNPKKIKIRGTNEFVEYDDVKRIGVAISSLGASKAISVGAYTYALSQLDNGN
ncbi:MAG: ROK family protein [Muribaculaceae bacterium]|nr:ROK family protein [Muribaculaceae bacterium]